MPSLYSRAGRLPVLIGQLVRYGLVGGAVTILQGAVYWLLSSQAGWDPQLSNLAGYLAAVTTGFMAHGSFTFRGHARQSAAPARLARFIGVSLVSLALNAFWVWLTVTMLGLPLWAPLPFMAVVTPGLVFILNRKWVFR